MTAGIISIPTLADVPTENVLEAAKGARLDPVLVLGFDEQGELYARSSTGHEGVMIHLIELFKHRLLAGNYG